MGDENHIRTLGDYSKPSHKGYRNTIELPKGNNVVPLRSDTIQLVQNECSFYRLRFEDPNQHLKDFLNLVDSLDLNVETRERMRESLSEAWTRFKDLLQKVPHHGIDLWIQVQIFYDHVNPATSTSNRRLIELKKQVQHLMEAHLTLKQPILVNKIASSCEICSGPHDTQYCMENPKQSFVDYASSRIDEVGGKCSINAITICPKQPNKSCDNKSEEEEEENGKPENININPPSPPNPTISLITEKEDDGDIMFIEIVMKYEYSRKEELEEDENIMTEGLGVEYFDIFPTRSKLAYHKKLNPRKDPNRGVSNFTGRIKGMHIFIENFTYVSDFMIVEDITSIIDPRLSQLVLGKPFVEISNMTHDLSLGVVRNEEDKRRGVDYVMSKILGFYKECLELGPGYLTGLEDEGGVTLYLMRRSLEVLRKFPDDDSWRTI
ncbi:hypothetical protein Tco_0505468 [Tanacetum coccineum]